MFVGHYAAALAAKAAEPKAPLWTYVVAAQFIDIGWSSLVMVGVEKVRVDESLPGSALDLYHMPFTHSLPGCLVWTLAAVALARYVLRLRWGPSVTIGMVVFSHWILDLLVHRPDLELWFGGAKVGLGLWNYPVPEQAVEIGLLGLGAAAWAWRRGEEGRSLWPVITFTTALIALQIIAMMAPAAADSFALGRTALTVYVVMALLALLLEPKGWRSS